MYDNDLCKYIADDLGEEDYEYEWDPEWKMHLGEENDETNSDSTSECNDAENMEGECVYLPPANNPDNIIISRRLAYLDANEVITSSASLSSIEQMPLPVPYPEIRSSLIYIAYLEDEPKTRRRRQA
jgi:hypothetical protein